MRRNKKRGITLVELIISIAIFSIVMTAAAAVFFTTLEQLAQSATLLDDQYNTRMAILSIVREIRRGDAGKDAMSVHADHLQSRLTIRRWDVNEAGEIVGDVSEIVYRLDGGVLRREGDIEDTPVAFAQVELQTFRPSVATITIPPATAGGPPRAIPQWLTLEVQGRGKREKSRR
jgi:prepilin-type N-terminal cleavage/methylation domain-containing protein